MDQCENCGEGTQYVPGQAGGLVETCPNCGEQPYRNQPSGSDSEMSVHTNPDLLVKDFAASNPLQEGILGQTDGGWKNRMKRDESFASVQASQGRGLEDNGQFGRMTDPTQLGPNDIQYSMDKLPQFYTDEEPCPNCQGQPGNTNCPHCQGEGYTPGSEAQRRPEGDDGGNTPHNVQNMMDHIQLPPNALRLQGGLWDRERMYLPWNADTSKIAQDFDVTQVVPDGPHTLEVDMNDSPLTMQHEDPDVLEEAKQKITGGILGDLAGAAGGLAGVALAPEGIPFALAGGMAGRALGTGAANAVGNSLQTGGGGQGGSGGPGAPSAGTEDGSQDILPLASIHAMFIHSDAETQLSYPGPHDTNDPESVDPHEKNDGDNKDWQKAFDTNDIGGTGTAFPLHSELGEAFKQALPALLESFDKPGSGKGHPDIEHLVELLEKEHPGSTQLELGPEHLDEINSVKMQTGDHHPGPDEDGKEHSIMAAMGPGTGVPQGGMTVDPTTQGVCPHCGAMIQPGTQICPQCHGAIGMGAGPQTQQMQGVPGAMPQQMEYPTPVGPVARVGANQGPQNQEQFQAVAQWLKDHGRGHEIEQLLMSPDTYADVLAQIQQKGTIPPEADPNDPAQPPMPPPGGMPPGAGGPPGMPPPGGGGMMPQGKVAADSVARVCPKCGSHTTSLVSEDGDCMCTRCGNHFKMPSMMKDDVKSTSSKVALINPVGIPSADQNQQYDPMQDQAPGWTTEDGQELVPGQMYEMYSNKYDIPDDIMVTHKTHNTLEYTLTGAYNLNHSTSLTQQEAQMDGIKFRAKDQGQNIPDETATGVHQDSDNTGYTGTPEQDNLATMSHYRQSDADSTTRWLYDQAQKNGPDWAKEWAPKTILSPEQQERLHRTLENPGQGGVNYDSHQWQPGSPGNILSVDGHIHSWPVDRSNPQSIIDASHSQYMQNQLGLDLSGYQTPGKVNTGSIEPNGEVSWHGVDPGTPQHQQLMSQVANVDPNLHSSDMGSMDWGDEPQVPQGQPAYARVAGAKFSPMEQKAFVNEPGQARNLDKLDLSYTHYQEPADEEFFLFGL